MLQGFKKFILKGNVVDLAVGVVVGVAFNAVVQSLVKGLITPLIGAFGGSPDFSSLKFAVNGSTFLIGDFLNALLSFIINSAVIYFFVVLPVNKLTEATAKKKKDNPANKVCPQCLSTIPLGAHRCAYCTSVLKK